MLAAGGALALGPSRGAGAAPACAASAKTDSLAAIACAKGILFGSAMGSEDVGREDYADLLASQCAVLVPDWEMKWRALQGHEGSFDFTRVDRIAAFALQHSMTLRGHTLVWFDNMPGWLKSNLDAGNWNEIMGRHFQAVIGRYRDITPSWDVVNEAVEPEHGRDDGLRRNPWLAAAGPGYIAAAFRMAARMAAPGTRLVYNDYGVEHEAAWTRKRRAAILALLEGLKKDGVPVTGFGMQSHLRVGDDFDQRTFSRFLDEIRGLGLTPMVTEFDVRADRVSGAAAKDAKVAALGRAYLDVALAGGADTVICWGLSDDKNWRKENPDDRPLPYDRALAPKALRQAIAESLRAAPAQQMAGRP